MGLYLDTEDIDKEEWLDLHGSPRNLAEWNWEETPKGQLPVVVVYNSRFSAAGIAFCKSEYEIFKRPDGRLKRLYHVAILDLIKEVPDLQEYIAKGKILDSNR